MEYNIDKSAIIGPSDSSFKVFFKEFFTNSRTRYSVETPLNKDDPNVVKGSPKDNFWQTNLLKIALCFTIVVPIAAGVYKLVEMQKLKNYKFVPMKSGAESPAARTSNKVDELKPGSEKRQSKEIPSSEVKPVSTQPIHPDVYKFEAPSFPKERLEGLFISLFENSNFGQKDTLVDFKKLVDSGKVFVCEEHEINFLDRMKTNYYVKSGKGESKKYLGISTDLIEKFKKDQNLEVGDKYSLMGQILEAVRGSETGEEPKPVTQKQKPVPYSSTTAGQKEETSPPLVGTKKTVPSIVSEETGISPEVKAGSEESIQPLKYEITAVAYGDNALTVADNCKIFFNHLYSTSDEDNQKLLNDFKELNGSVQGARGKVRIQVLTDFKTYGTEKVATLHAQGSDFWAVGSRLDISKNLLEKFDKIEKFDKKDAILEADVKHLMEQIQKAVNHSKGVIQEKSKEGAPAVTSGVSSKEVKPVSTNPTQPVEYKLSAIIGLDKSTQDIFEEFFKYLYSKSENNKKLLNEFKELNERATFALGKVKIQVEEDYKVQDEEQKTFHAKGSSFKLYGKNPFLDISKNLLDKFDKKDRSLDTDVEYLMGEIQKAIEHSRKPK